ncbi:MAG: glycine cleavage system protein GcvH [Actinobacteria bacterium]|jgi:glycine cleavage system H protein|nr:glycine cleavage system protein GcvH [Actinomycetota bacterium]
MDTPSDLRYTSDHEWVRIEGDVATIGITDYAQDALGDVVFVQLPSAGSTVKATASISEVESTKSVSDIYAPLSGEVIEVNDALEADPSVLNSDAYGKGWIFKVRISDPSEISTLLSASDYEDLLGKS